MKLKTVRVRRNRPSVLSAALALMLTMLFVYAISLSAPDSVNDAAAQLPSAAEIRMEGMDVSFLCAERATDPLEARIRASYCAQQGGAGLILPDGDEYAIILEAVSDPDAAGGIRRQADGLTLKLTGSAAEVAANGGKPIVLRARGWDCIAAAHAYAAEPQLFTGVDFAKRPPSWTEMVTNPDTKDDSFAVGVWGALMDYDWVDLVEY